MKFFAILILSLLPLTGLDALELPSEALPAPIEGEKAVSESTPDLIPAAEALVSRINSANKSLNKYDLVPSASNNNLCEEIRGNDSFGKGLYAKSCKSPLPDDLMQKNLVLVIPYESYEKIPAELKLQFPEPEKSLWSKQYKMITVINEFGLTSATLLGDDMGYTTETRFGFGATYDNKIDVEARMSGALFTKRQGGLQTVADGIKTGDQKFKNETIFEILANNKREGKLMYWDVKAGLVNISSKENMGVLDGSFQQDKFHAFLNRNGIGKNVRFNNIDDKKKDSNGAFIESIVGLQHRFQLGCIDMIANAGLGAGVSNLKQYRSGIANAGFTGTITYGQRYYEGGATVEQRIHPEGVLRTTTLFAGTGVKDKYDARFTIENRSGNLQNGTRDYNLPNRNTGKNDKGMMLKVKFYNNFLN